MRESNYNFPRRQSRTIVSGGSNGPYWAVNIGTLAAPVLTVEDGVISGKTTGTAAILKKEPGGGLEVTSGRQSFERYADGDEIADGTLIQLDSVNGKITIVFANCSPTTGLTGLDPTP